MQVARESRAEQQRPSLGRRLELRAKALVLGLIARLGYELRRPSAPPPWRPVGRAFHAGTILDVGAADGTPGLYAAYPEAHIVAFDPLAEQLDRLVSASPQQRIETVNVALGAAEGEAELSVPEDVKLKSSLHQRTALTADGGTISSRRVPVRCLDDLVREHDWPKPYVLKIDTEGHELEVLRGAVETLRDCAVVYTEASLAERFVAGYRFRELSEFFFERDFDLVDVLEAWRGANGHVYFLDCVWTPRADGGSERSPPTPGSAAP
jgi:FkbM family methyltransferase